MASAPHSLPSSNRAAAAADHVGGFQFGMSAGQRELDAPVLPDRPVEDDALLCVLDSLLKELATVADALLRDQNPLGIHAVENVAADQFSGDSSRLSKKISVVLWLIIALIGQNSRAQTTTSR
jgi:hypothetical protein